MRTVKTAGTQTEIRIGKLLNIKPDASTLSNLPDHHPITTDRNRVEVARNTVVYPKVSGLSR